MADGNWVTADGGDNDHADDGSWDQWQGWRQYSDDEWHKWQESKCGVPSGSKTSDDLNSILDDWEEIKDPVACPTAVEEWTTTN
eukprot:8605189-Karenia_brevis.AAC.1